MPHWSDFKHGSDVLKLFIDTGRKIRNREVEVGRAHYALTLALGVWQAVVLGYDEITAVEFGVAQGQGLLDLCKAAQFLRDTAGVNIKVYGFDGAFGLPKSAGYKDHPEIWNAGEYKMTDPAALRAKLPDFAQLIIGDIGETIGEFEAVLSKTPLGFVAVDVDLYSSAKLALRVFQFDHLCYVPAVPIYFDDMFNLLTYNQWCGEEAAIREFNFENELRKIQRHDVYHLHACHILDHPVRTGQQKLRSGFTLHIYRI
jgi:hypothetical protein